MSSSDRLARSLILYAARNAPVSLAQRLEEEWLADFEARRAGLARLRLALGCCWATRIIARDCRVRGTVVAASGASGVLAPQARPRAPLASRRAVALCLIASLHVGLIWILATGLLQRMVTAPPARFQATLLAATPRTLPPPLRDPTLKHTQIEVPPIVDLVPLPPTDEDAIRGTGVRPSAPPVQGAAQPVSRVWGGPGHGFPSTADFYPPPAIRAEVEGGATVRVCVDESGRLTVAPAIEQPSGNALLDAAALKLARAGSGHYRPTTDDGRAVSSCYPLRVRFQLR
jgi:TonB family protein